MASFRICALARIDALAASLMCSPTELLFFLNSSRAACTDPSCKDKAGNDLGEGVGPGARSAGGGVANSLTREGGVDSMGQPGLALDRAAGDAFGVLAT